METRSIHTRLMLQTMEVTTMELTEPSNQVREEARTTTMEETSNASTATKPTCPIPLFTLIWSRSIQRDQMESSEIHQQAEEVEEDLEKIHTRDLTQGPRISSRLPRGRVVPSIPYAASRKFTTLFSLISLWIKQCLNKKCSRIRSMSISSNFQTW